MVRSSLELKHVELVDHSLHVRGPLQGPNSSENRCDYAVAIFFGEVIAHPVGFRSGNPYSVVIMVLLVQSLKMRPCRLKLEPCLMWVDSFFLCNLFQQI